jgi:hypothetical protein
MSYFILISKIPDVKLQYGRKLWIVCLYCMGDQKTDVGFWIIWSICVCSVQVIKMSVGDFDAFG